MVGFLCMLANGFDLAASAHQEMIDEGFHPDFPPEVQQQLKALRPGAGLPAGGDVRDLRAIEWSSIDNDTSRDLDQAEAAERVSGGIRIMIAIADVDSVVTIGSPIDLHAADIEDRLKREGKLTLTQLIVGRKSRSEMIGVFLALLELIREKKILVQQADALGEMEIEVAPPEHQKQYEFASLHLADEKPAEDNPAEAPPPV